MGHVLPLDLRVLLQDISAGGFAAVATIHLTDRVAYDVRFTIQPHTAVVRARLAYAMRLSRDPESGYILGFEFVDAKRDEAPIAALIAEAMGCPKKPTRSPADLRPVSGPSRAARTVRQIG
jgi:hypothetical protein